MTETPLVFDANDDNFTELVLDNSEKGPVLVNFWSPGAGPCVRMYPLLDKLVHEYGGRFILVNVDVQTETGLAERLGVNSVPLIKLFKRRQAVESLPGYQLEDDMRRLLNRHTARPSDRPLAEALQVYQQGDVERCLQMLAAAAVDDPDNLRVPLAISSVLVNEGRLEEAADLLSALPEQARLQPDIESRRIQIDLARAKQVAPSRDELLLQLQQDERNADARYQLAAVLLAEGEVESALEALLTLLQQNRDYHDDAARRAMLSVFQTLGDDHELTERFRASMTLVLH